MISRSDSVCGAIQAKRSEGQDRGQSLVLRVKNRFVEIQKFLSSLDFFFVSFFCIKAKERKTLMTKIICY